MCKYLAVVSLSATCNGDMLAAAAATAVARGGDAEHSLRHHSELTTTDSQQHCLEHYRVKHEAIIVDTTR